MRPLATNARDNAHTVLAAPQDSQPVENGDTADSSHPTRLITRRRLLGATLSAMLATPAIGLAGYGYVKGVEPGWVAIERVELRLPRLHPAFDGLRLVQLSDIHMDRWMTGERLRDVVRQTNELKPDLIAITGDFVTERPVPSSLAALVPELRQLIATIGIFAVLGVLLAYAGRRRSRVNIYAN